MADTWQTIATAGTIVVTLPGAGAFGYANALTNEMYFAFVAQDLPDARFPTIKINYRIKSDGTGLETFEQHGFSGGGDAQAAFVPHSSGTSSFVGAAQFESGGTLTITKNETTGEYQFSGLLGTSAVPFASIFGGVSAGEMAPDRVFIQASTVFTWNDGTFTTSTERDVVLTVRWSNFFGKKNGTDIKGANLGSTDRGSWTPSGGAFDPWFTSLSAGTTGAIANTGAAVGFTLTIDGDDPAIGSNGTVFLDWDQSVYLVSAGSGGQIDMTRSIEHGTLWAAIIYAATPTQVKVRRSFDASANWEEITAYNVGGTDNRSVSVNWHMGRVWLTWHNGTSILQSNSFDLGTTWGAPVVLGITGTSPRHLVDPMHGISLYFHINGGNLQVMRSGDFGSSFIDGAPITVVTGIETQTVAAAVMPSGAYLLGYIAAGAWTQLRSLDYGRTWA